ncbi:hypothetical protein BDP27DRAFT_1362197 [Rhodocollybia butyracea]|uniref:Ig-like domain-containing protein n=1 Tax=Rhodocollybia butyracea TaxID=206335 RepID=A0A9P5U8H2_9AGAR|nr:hypothetical protein BDP27DRAFT_1362197 [Rhodocollybia butyracea]
MDITSCVSHIGDWEGIPPAAVVSSFWHRDYVLVRSAVSLRLSARGKLSHHALAPQRYASYRLACQVFKTMDDDFADESQRRRAAAHFLDISAQEDDKDDELLDWTDEWDDLESLEEAQKTDTGVVGPLLNHYDSSNNPRLFQDIIMREEQRFAQAANCSLSQPTFSSSTHESTTTIRSPSPHLDVPILPELHIHPTSSAPSDSGIDIEPIDPRFAGSGSVTVNTSRNEEPEPSQLPLSLRRTFSDHTDQDLLLRYPIFLVHCLRGHKNRIYCTIRKAILDEYSKEETFRIPITRRLIAAVYRSQLPGVVYLQVPSMWSRNVPLAMYLRWIGGFIYRHEQMVTAPALPYDARKSRFLSAGMRADIPFAGNILRLELPIHQVISIEDRYLLTRDALYKQDGMVQSKVTPGAHTMNIIFPIITPEHQDTRFLCGSWFRLIGGNPLYNGNVGCVFHHPTNDKYRQVILLPWVPQTKDDFEFWASQKGHSASKRKRSPPPMQLPPPVQRERPVRMRFNLSAAHGLAAMFHDEPPELWHFLAKPPKPPNVWSCIAECKDPWSCSHDPNLKLFDFAGESYVGGFLTMKVRLSHLGEVTQPDGTTLHAFASAPEEIGIPLLPRLPVPHSWKFNIGDQVLLDRPNVDGTGHTDYEFAGGTVATIAVVHEHECEVQVKWGIYSKPKSRLRKCFEVGSEVLFPGSDNSLGHPAIFTGVDTETWVALLMLKDSVLGSCHVNELQRVPPGNNNDQTRPIVDAPTVEQLSQLRASTSTGRCPWKDVTVRITRHSAFAGYLGRVFDAKKEPTSISGLHILVKLEAGYLAREVWVDYAHLWRESDHKFLDQDVVRNRVNDYYSFKDGYTPKFSAEETLSLICYKDTSAIVELEQWEEQIQRHIAAGELERTQPLTPGAPQRAPHPGDWLEDSRTFDALRGFEFYVFIWEGPLKGDVGIKADRRVWLSRLGEQEVLPGQPTIHILTKDELDTRKQTIFRSMRILPGDICVPEAESLSNGHPISFRVPQSGAEAMGLYYVWEGAHCGKLGRRIGFVKPPPDSTYTSTGLFILQRVEFKRERQSRNWVFRESITGERFQVHRNNLIVVHEPIGLHKKAEELILPYRLDYLRMFQVNAGRKTLKPTNADVNTKRKGKKRAGNEGVPTSFQPTAQGIATAPARLGLDALAAQPKPGAERNCAIELAAGMTSNIRSRLPPTIPSTEPSPVANLPDTPPRVPCSPSSVLRRTVELFWDSSSISCVVRMKSLFLVDKLQTDRLVQELDAFLLDQAACLDAPELVSPDVLDVHHVVWSQNRDHYNELRHEFRHLWKETVEAGGLYKRLVKHDNELPSQTDRLKVCLEKNRPRSLVEFDAGHHPQGSTIQDKIIYCSTFDPRPRFDWVRGELERDGHTATDFIEELSPGPRKQEGRRDTAEVPVAARTRSSTGVAMCNSGHQASSQEDEEKSTDGDTGEPVAACSRSSTKVASRRSGHRVAPHAADDEFSDDDAEEPVAARSCSPTKVATRTSGHRVVSHAADDDSTDNEPVVARSRYYTKVAKRNSGHWVAPQAADDEYTDDSAEDPVAVGSPQNANEDSTDNGSSDIEEGGDSKEGCLSKAELKKIEEFRKAIIAEAKLNGRNPNVYLSKMGRPGFLSSKGFEPLQCLEEDLQAYSARIHQAYLAALEERLPEAEGNDKKAQRRAFQHEYDWYMECIGKATKADPSRGTRRVVKTLTNIIEATTGYHLICTLMHTGTDGAGRNQSLHFAMTEQGRLVKLNYNTNLSGQLDEMSACFKVVEMEGRGGDFPNATGASRAPKGSKINIACIREVSEPLEKHLLSLYESCEDVDTASEQFDFVAWTDDGDKAGQMRKALKKDKSTVPLYDEDTEDEEDEEDEEDKGNSVPRTRTGVTTAQKTVGTMPRALTSAATAARMQAVAGLWQQGTNALQNEEVIQLKAKLAASDNSLRDAEESMRILRGHLENLENFIECSICLQKMTTVECKPVFFPVFKTVTTSSAQIALDASNNAPFTEHRYVQRILRYYFAIWPHRLIRWLSVYSRLGLVWFCLGRVTC